MSANGSGHIISITACIAIELAGSGVQVNGVAPGVTDTPMLPRGEENWGFLRTLAPNGKTGVRQDIVDAVLYLTGSQLVTGSIMTVDGGSTAGTW
jgi:NAD(P)-dependent dehydrogenase (short-subunit alcohol dehydrogenase family)